MNTLTFPDIVARLNGIGCKATPSAVRRFLRRHKLNKPKGRPALGITHTWPAAKVEAAISKEFPQARRAA
jgi:hypothetical protein